MTVSFEELQRLEAASIITPVTEPSKWASALLVLTKPNGKTRICIDPKLLNKALLRSHYCLPMLDLSDLMQDVRRLMVLAYSAQTSEMWESVAINAFLEAVDDPDLALEVRKRGPTTLDEAYRDALLLEGFVKTCMNTDHAKGKGQIRATSDKNLDLCREVEELRGLLKRQENSHRQQLEKQEKRFSRYNNRVRIRLPITCETQTTAEIPRQM